MSTPAPEEKLETIVTLVPSEPAQTKKKKKKKKKKNKDLFSRLLPKNAPTPSTVTRASSKALAKMARAFADALEQFVEDTTPDKDEKDA